MLSDPTGWAPWGAASELKLGSRAAAAPPVTRTGGSVWTEAGAGSAGPSELPQVQTRCQAFLCLHQSIVGWGPPPNRGIRGQKPSPKRVDC